MNPRLAAIAGPLKGANFTLTEDETSIGRESANRICLSDASVSRRHCTIRREGDLFKVTDLESLNGTFVNDVPVKERYLEHGDRLRLGDFTFSFLLEEGDSAPGSSTVLMDEGQLTTGTNTLQVRLADAFHLMARDLSVLMKIATTINSARGLEAVQRQLLELIFEVVPADSGAILLAELERTTGPLPENTSGFMRGFGDQNRQFWKDFVAWLESLDAGAEFLASASAAAVETFGSFIAAFSVPSPAPVPSR